MEKFFQIFQDLHFDISFADALLLMPKFASTIKSLFTNKDKLFELAKIPLNENCSVMLLKKLPKKLGDPSKFCIPCDFSGMDLAHRSITRPKGVVEDVFVKIGKFHFSTDFIVVDFEADPRVPLILGRSFLRTDRALIDVYEEEITLRVNDEAVTFNLNQTTRYSFTYDPRFCTHKILMEEDFKPSFQSHRRINPKIHEVIKREVLKLLDAGMIYPISDSPWVSPIHCVPKKGGITVVANEENELIPTLLGQPNTKHYQPIHYARKTMTEAQMHYTTTEKEMLAVVYAFEKCRLYLVLSKSTVYTDHSALKYLLNKQDAKSRLIWWVLLLQEFDIIIRDKERE
nr:reverse transcriptase domain-containing protein [Tanacetum cinerariifolium]